MKHPTIIHDLLKMGQPTMVQNMLEMRHPTEIQNKLKMGHPTMVQNKLKMVHPTMMGTQCVANKRCDLSKSVQISAKPVHIGQILYEIDAFKS